jgi:hypothetical protein
MRQEKMFEPPKAPKDRRRLDTQIEDIVGVFADPVVLRHPQGICPDWLRKQITTDRLILLMKKKLEVAALSEVCAYLSDASLDAPLDWDWTRVYMYAFTKTMERANREVPDDLRVEKLDMHEGDLLNKLRRDIYRSRKKHRPKRRKNADAKKAGRSHQGDQEIPKLTADQLPIFDNPGQLQPGAETVRKVLSSK